MRLRWRKDHSLDRAYITTANVETLGFQCPVCGVPVDVVHLVTPGEPDVRLEPCGHDAAAHPTFGITALTRGLCRNPDCGQPRGHPSACD
jgi:hypothetical protein